MGTSIAAGPLLSLAVNVTSEQHVESVLRKIVEGLASQPGVALVRIWLLPSVHIPNGWREGSHSQEGLEHLRLVASAGTPINSPGEDWSYLQGRFARFPLNMGKVGQVAAGRRPIFIKNLAPQNSWVMRPEWAEREEIRSFAGHPLIFRENLLGVIGLFSRTPLDEQEFNWLGLFANHAAVAIANARAFEEVAEREKVEGEVRQVASGLEAKIRRLVEANVVGIVMWNLEGAITGANEAFLHMVQYDHEDLASGRVRWTDLTPDEWRDRDERAIAELRASSFFQPFEREFFRKDGSRLPVLLGGALFEGDGNEGVAFVLDLTDQKRQESARLYSEASYRVVVETANDAIVSIDDEGSIVFANPATATVFGYDPTELTGKPLTLLMPEYMRELHNSGFKRYLTTGQRHINWQGTELTALRKNGEEFPVEVSFGELTRDGHKIFTGIIRDISTRKRGEQALRRSEAFLTEGQRLGQIGSYSWRVATDEITWSEQLYRTYEIEMGTPVTLELIRTRVHPEDLALYEKMVEQARNGNNDFEWQYRLLMPDHSIKYLHAVARATRDQDGQLEYIAAIQDVTARRLSEEARDKARSELAHLVRMMSLGTLAASIAHEINQPLSGIVTNASTCQRMLAAAPPNIDGALETARRTIRDANRASEVITRLRALFNRKETAPESMDLNEATREVIELSLGGLQRNGVMLRYEPANDLPPVVGDRIQLQQVIMNLLRNAADAMSAIDDRPRELLIRTERAGARQVRLSVKDSGVGFAPQAADKIFEAFYTTKSDGMGMGLCISRSIIEAHRGRLWATPNDGPGSTFSFAIPCTPEGLADAGTRVNRAGSSTDAA